MRCHRGNDIRANAGAPHKFLASFRVDLSIFLSHWLMLHKIFILTVAVAWESIALSSVDDRSPGRADTAENECVVTWANLIDPKKITVEVFADRIADPSVAGRTIRAIRIKSFEYTSKDGEVQRRTTDIIKTVIDSEMLSALSRRDVSEHVDEQTLCREQLKIFAEYMDDSSERYRADAARLGIMPGSKSFTAWSILNLIFEWQINRRFGESITEEKCVISAGAWLSYIGSSGLPPSNEMIRATVKAGYVPEKNVVDIKFFSVNNGLSRKEGELPAEELARLNADLRSMRYHVTTENLPPEKYNSDSCHYYFEYRGWQLEQMLPPNNAFTVIDYGSIGHYKLFLPFYRWIVWDRIREKDKRRAEKKRKKCEERKGEGQKKPCVLS